MSVSGLPGGLVTVVSGPTALLPDDPRRSPDVNRIRSNLQQHVAPTVKDTFVSFGEDECSLRAAALAYHTLLSLFPLLLFLVFVGGELLSGGDSLHAVESLVRRLAPQAATTVNKVIAQTVRARGPIGLIGGLGLLYSASAIFAVLSSTFNVIWGAKRRAFWRRILIGLLAVLLVVLLFIFSLFTRAVGALDLVPAGGLAWVSSSLDFWLTLLACWVLYVWLPNDRVIWWAAFGGALLAACLWQVAKIGFGIYLTSGLTHMDLVYGSLASVVILVLWVYFSSIILFVGAELAASIQANWRPGQSGG